MKQRKLAEMEYSLNSLIRIFIISITIFILFSLQSFAQYEPSQQIDLNSATLEEISQLPIAPEQVEAIASWLEFIGPFESVYDLQKVKGIDYETFIKIKPLVKISPVMLHENVRRIEDNYYKIERWISTEGASESFVANWIDRLSNPVNVNDIGFFELINFQSVSPVDALAVLKRRELGEIRNRRDLRNSENLSHYGFTNLEDFIRYDDIEDKTKFGGSFSTVVKNITLSQTPSDDPGSFSEFKAHKYPLDTFNKLRLHWGTDLRFEMSYLRNLGEENFYYNEGKFKIPRIKAFVGIDNRRIGIVKFNKIIIGDYTAGFGQGVILDATDFFLPRKTGFAWRKRMNGITGNISRTTEYGLRGAAIEAQIGSIIGTAFYSLNERDAIVNNDGSFSTFITMYPRMRHGLYDQIPKNIVRSVKEMMFGNNLKYMIIPGTYIGTTIYQSLYDRELNLQVKNTLLNSSGQGKYLTQIGNSADSEIATSYSSSNNSSFWKRAKAARRVYGFEFMSVFRNICLQGEYAELDKNESLFDRKSDPKAYVISGYIQFDNFNFLLLYRNYDLEFDNPYQRSFSNYQRFKGSIYEDIFYLRDPILGYLYSGTAQPQAERGLYYTSRYQIHRTLVTSIEHDIWIRVADKAQYNRLTLNLEYRPVFKYRFKIRQKWQSRDKTNTLSPVAYQVNETRLEATVRMSRYNQIRVLYSLGFVEFTPRSRLVKNAETGGDSYVGNAGSPSKALGMTVTHNVNERVKLIGSIITYKGFLWNFEDTDFRIFNTDTQALHGWLTVFSRLSRNFSVRFKYTFDLHDPMTNIIGGQIDIEESINGDSFYTIDEISTQKFYSDFRLQIDYRF